MILKYWVYPLIFFLFLGVSALADDATEVEQLIKGKVDQVVSILRDKSLGKQERNEKIIPIVNATFDFVSMAKLSLGKKYWLGFSRDQQQEFIHLFREQLQKSYVDKLDLYTDEKVEYEPAIFKGKKGQLPTYLISKDTRYSMLYKLHNLKNNWKIYDIEIQGVSIIKTYRSQFDGELRKGTIADLLKKLKSPEEFSINTVKKNEDVVK
ncbi:MAG TPA: ABC transporter substrate-binding protein [Nitrospiria bacterium]|jgi:phospholipid transport system substrate-binding protein